MLEEDLSYAEKLTLQLHRTRHLTRRAHAASLGATPALYGAWLRGEGEGPAVDLGGLEPREVFTVLRLRAGLTREQMARVLGVSRRMVAKMEIGEIKDLRRLVDAWT